MAQQLRDKMEALSFQRTMTEETKRRRFRSSADKENEVSFYIASDEPGCSHSPQGTSHFSPKSRERGNGLQSPKKRPSQKILFTAEDEITLSEDDEGTNFIEPPENLGNISFPSMRKEWGGCRSERKMEASKSGANGKEHFQIPGCDTPSTSVR